MIIRSHRAADFMACKKLAQNLYHRQFLGDNDWNLRVGTAVHKGVEIGREHSDWYEATNGAEGSLRAASSKASWYPGKDDDEDVYAAIVRRCVDVIAADMVLKPQVKVIVPECEFEVALADSEHYCVFEPGTDKHRQLIPHYAAGRTDALVDDNGAPWLDEFKTTAIMGENFWSEFTLDLQPTVYMLGIYKQTGIMPHGVTVHALYKPSQSQVNNWNKQRAGSAIKKIEDYIKYDSQRFIRTPDDLDRCESQLVSLCNEWERRYIRDDFPMSNYRGGPCHRFNRECQFHTACLNHDSAFELDKFRKSNPENVRLYHIDGAIQKGRTD